jgi:hypothetical protein
VLLLPDFFGFFLFLADFSVAVDFVCTLASVVPFFPDDADFPADLGFAGLSFFLPGFLPGVFPE